MAIAPATWHRSHPVLTIATHWGADLQAVRSWSRPQTITLGESGTLCVPAEHLGGADAVELLVPDGRNGWALLLPAAVTEGEIVLAGQKLAIDGIRGQRVVLREEDSARLSAGPLSFAIQVAAAVPTVGPKLWASENLHLIVAGLLAAVLVIGPLWTSFARTDPGDREAKNYVEQLSLRVSELLQMEYRQDLGLDFWPYREMQQMEWQAKTARAESREPDGPTPHEIRIYTPSHTFCENPVRWCSGPDDSCSHLALRGHTADAAREVSASVVAAVRTCAALAGKGLLDLDALHFEATWDVQDAPPRVRLLQGAVVGDQGHALARPVARKIVACAEQHIGETQTAIFATEVAESQKWQKDCTYTIAYLGDEPSEPAVHGNEVCPSECTVFDASDDTPMPQIGDRKETIWVRYMHRLNGTRQHYAPQ